MSCELRYNGTELFVNTRENPSKWRYIVGSFGHCPANLPTGLSSCTPLAVGISQSGTGGLHRSLSCCSVTCMPVHLNLSVYTSLCLIDGLGDVMVQGRKVPSWALRHILWWCTNGGSLVNSGSICDWMCAYMSIGFTVKGVGDRMVQATVKRCEARLGFLICYLGAFENQ